LIAKGFFGDCDFVIAKPQTYMNLSGLAVVDLLKKYKLKTDNLIVVYDDIDLQRGALRFREKGSAGTHNGMRSIVGHLGTSDFKRLRLGIGRPDDDTPLHEFVLSNIAFEHKKTFFDLFNEAANYLIDLKSV
ncbi:MAG: aminoacyl-tRNA hydrolase, partial [Firmicutes bacterium]|nr:aminoacyl-tRNA hydrolase [Bacillota bacterium]